MSEGVLEAGMLGPRLYWDSRILCMLWLGPYTGVLLEYTVIYFDVHDRFYPVLLDTVFQHAELPLSRSGFWRICSVKEQSCLNMTLRAWDFVAEHCWISTCDALRISASFYLTMSVSVVRSCFGGNDFRRSSVTVFGMD